MVFNCVVGAIMQKTVVCYFMVTYPDQYQAAAPWPVW